MDDDEDNNDLIITTRLMVGLMCNFQSLAENAVLGIALGVSLAFPVLVLATCNIINGFLATLTICCVTVCVIGVIPLGGWKLGVSCSCMSNVP